MIAPLAALALAASQPTVDVQGGRVAGERLPDGSAVFRGIPFARPPVGILRWQPPRPIEPWSGVRDATRTAPACPQPDQGWNTEAAARASEDCLYLEVRSPNLKPAKRLPVMVWIHGGSNVAGSGAGTVMSGIVAHGIVIVSIQYRLGALGFMSHPALSRESRAGSSGNYALMDQQAALRWVKANAAGFGGDPDNVTVFGESAGALDVGLLLVAPGARGLFQKAIEESGTPQFGAPAVTLAENEQIGEEIAVRAGLPDATVAQLRSIPAKTLTRALERPFVVAGQEVSTPWLAAVVDGTVIREAPSRTLARGGQARVPLIIGANSREYEVGAIAADPAAFLRRTGGVNADQMLAYYGLPGDGSVVDDPMLGTTTMQVSSDLIFRCPAVTVATAQARIGAPVWQYHFAYSAPGQPPVAHNSELRYVFNAPGEQGIPADAAPLQAYWINFARSGDPNGPGLALWPRYDIHRRAYLAFLPEGPRVEARLRDEICQFVPLP